MSEIRWYDAGTRPARPGVYPVRVPNLDRKSWSRFSGPSGGSDDGSACAGADPVGCDHRLCASGTALTVQDGRRIVGGLIFGRVGGFLRRNRCITLQIRKWSAQRKLYRALLPAGPTACFPPSKISPGAAKPRGFLLPAVSRTPGDTKGQPAARSERL